MSQNTTETMGCALRKSKPGKKMHRSFNVYTMLF